jgi:hypothetical protein
MDVQGVGYNNVVKYMLLILMRFFIRHLALVTLKLTVTCI